MLTHEHLREILDYCPVTGIFRWKVKRCGRAMPGQITGALNSDGYKQIFLGGKHYKCHRLAWFYMTGEWPKNQIDHIDGNRGNNAFSNLREATNSQNQMNRSMAANNKSGVKGVCWYKSTQKWRAKIKFQGKETIRYFQTIEEASQWLDSMRNILHGDFASDGIRSRGIA